MKRGYRPGIALWGQGSLSLSPSLTFSYTLDDIISWHCWWVLDNNATLDLHLFALGLAAELLGGLPGWPGGRVLLLLLSETLEVSPRVSGQWPHILRCVLLVVLMIRGVVWARRGGSRWWRTSGARGSWTGDSGPWPAPDSPGLTRLGVTRLTASCGPRPSASPAPARLSRPGTHTAPAAHSTCGGRHTTSAILSSVLLICHGDLMIMRLLTIPCPITRWSPWWAYCPAPSLQSCSPGRAAAPARCRIWRSRSPC